MLTKPAAGTLGVGQWSSKWGPGASLGVRVGGLGVPNRADGGTPRVARWPESIFSMFSHVGGWEFSMLVKKNIVHEGKDLGALVRIPVVYDLKMLLGRDSCF